MNKLPTKTASLGHYVCACHPSSSQKLLVEYCYSICNGGYTQHCQIVNFYFGLYQTSINLTLHEACVLSVFSNLSLGIWAYIKYLISRYSGCHEYLMKYKEK